MKLFTIIATATTLTAASATKPMLRTAEVEAAAKESIEINNNNESARNLQSCVSSATYLGCYANKNSDRALPLEAFGPKSRGHTAQECKDQCLSMGFSIFAREFRGQCFCGDSNYSKHGVAMGCDCCGENVGGNKFCAWEAGLEAPGCTGSGSDSSTYLGCYANKNNHRALPYQVDGKGHSVTDCEEECGKLGFSHFAREWKGQCFCGNKSDNYAVHGEENGCDCCGEDVGANKMCVYMNGMN